MSDAKEKWKWVKLNFKHIGHLKVANRDAEIKIICTNKNDVKEIGNRLIQCVNNFDRLLVACKKAAAYLEKCSNEIYADGVTAKNMCKQAVAAAEKGE
jgi:hypothetical protein